MKKLLLLSFIVCIIVNSASAQTQTVSYFNKGGIELLSPEGAYYVEYIENNPSGGGTRTRFLKADSVKVSLFTYSSFEGGEDDNGILNGAYYLWYNNGKPSEQGNYENNKLQGKLSTWFENGQISYEKYYAEGELQDTLRGYYENGALRRVEVYDNGEMVEGKVLSKVGKTIPYFPASVMPQFPGGENAMIGFVSRNLNYPDEAKEVGLSGLVVVSFIVEKNGAIKTLEIIKNVHEVLDEEAARVVKAMPRWEPGLLEGEPVAVRFSLPVRFTIVD